MTDEERIDAAIDQAWIEHTGHSGEHSFAVAIVKRHVRRAMAEVLRDARREERNAIVAAIEARGK